jgi:hypothetical protein
LVQTIDEALSSLASSEDSSAFKGPIIIRLSGYTQHNDKLAMREIGKQLVRQTGMQALDGIDEEDEDCEQDAIQGITELVRISFIVVGLMM